MNASAVLMVVFAALGQAATSGAAGRQASHPPSKGLEELKQAAARYRIATATDPPRELTAAREPVLSWTNPLRSTHAGASFIWVAEGRPEAIASLYRFNEGGRIMEDHEFQSLATVGLSATRDGAAIWTPQAAGITLAPIPGAPGPAASPAERLRQMRALAQEFHAFFDNPDDHSELRLLTQPLYRYQAHRTDLVDGALFAFVVTTDPEVLLAIEARPVDGKPAWHYGFARMSMVNLRAQHKDREVWKAEWAVDLQDPTKPYFTTRAPYRSQ
jgi:hypothetical protein